MSDQSIRTTVEGGTVTGVVGAGTVVIENFYAGAAPARAAEPSTEAAAGECPYPGLAYFGPEDRDIFFGRQAAIDRLIDAVQRHALTALVGASGSGKSSVVLAGLAPQLAQTGGWRFTHFRVGIEADRNPFLALARALVPLFAGHLSETDRLAEVEKLASKLAGGELGLANVLSECRLRNAGRRILLIADQFEEIFTLIPDDAVRSRFIDLLLAGFAAQTKAGTPSVCMVLTLRADFYGMAVRHRPLSDALQGHVENLGPMTREELRDAIVCPAGRVGFEAGLVDTLLDDVSTRPGNLPLLQFALREMWFRQQKGIVTHEAYQAIGRVEGALAQRAQEIFDSQTNDGRDSTAVELFRRLFTRLVTLGQGVEDTRRVVDRGELGEDAWALAQRLAGEENRLLVTGAAQPGNETAEVVHEALIRNWPTLIGWVSKDREFQTWLRQLQSHVEQWRRHRDDEGTLLRGGLLAVAIDWIGRRRDDFSESEVAFIDASIRARDERRRQEDQERQAELRRQQELAEATQRLAEEQRARAEMAEQLAAHQGTRAASAADLARRRRRTAQIAIAGAVASLLFGGIALWLSYWSWVEARPWARITRLSTGATFDLSQNVALLGRPADGVEGLHQVPISGFRRISRLHTSIERSGRINDWKSAYGTTVNATPLLYGRARRLDDGSLIVASGIEAFSYHEIQWHWSRYLCGRSWPQQYFCPSAPEKRTLPPGTWALLLDGLRRAVLPITSTETYVTVNRDGFHLSDRRSTDAVLLIRKHQPGTAGLGFAGRRVSAYSMAFVLSHDNQNCKGVRTPLLAVELIDRAAPLLGRLKYEEYAVDDIMLPFGESVFMLYAGDRALQSAGQLTLAMQIGDEEQMFQIVPVAATDSHAAFEDMQEMDRECADAIDAAIRAVINEK